MTTEQAEAVVGYCKENGYLITYTGEVPDTMRDAENLVNFARDALTNELRDCENNRDPHIREAYHAAREVLRLAGVEDDARA